MPNFGKKALVVVLVAAALAAYVAFDVGSYLSLDYFKARQAAFQAYYADYPLQAIGLYCLAYLSLTALSLPGATIITLAGGALFGLGIGTLVVSFASAVGATLAFWTSRYLLRDWVRARFRKQFNAIDAGVAREGVFYLFSLRLLPLFPFFAVNLLMGLTSMRTWPYYWGSQLGMLAGTVVYVNAGTRLATIDDLGDIATPAILGSFVLLAVFPLIAKKLLALFKQRKLTRRWHKPARFDTNLIVIGAGSGGLVTAYIAAAVKAKVTLIESGEMGGDCLNYGCVPSKALIRTARFVHDARNASSFGINRSEIAFDFAQVMARVHRVIETIAPHDSVARYQGLGVDVMQGHARIVSPWAVEINGRQLTARSIVIAAGARPVVPKIPGLEDVGYVTSDSLWKLTTLPKRLIVLGGGPIGAELAQAFARLGSAVTQVEQAPRLLSREDAEVSTLISAALAADGVTILTAHEAVRCEREGERKRLFVRHTGSGQESSVEFDLLLCAVGRVARTEGYGLEELGIVLTPRKTIETDAWLQTLYPNVFACGDVTGPYQLTHAAAHQAWYAAVNALFGQFKRFKADYSVIPWCTFTAPEVARVGLCEQDATEQEIAYEVTRYDIGELDRAITDEVAHGFVKVLTVPGKDKILGVTIVADHAGELLAEYVLAMKHGLGLNKILGTIHVYPTMAEANKYAAGVWKRQHAPQRLLEWVRRYHDWRRGPPTAN
ncbi:MAG: FAD-dependent oxidoreductase [Pseudomonadota bacterium]